MSRRTVFAWLLAASASISCGESSPSAPTGVGYAGHWSGSTIQGGSVAFTVSEEQRVTSITVDYRVGTCSGSRTYSGLSLEIARPIRPPGNPSTGPFDNPGFGFGSGDPQAPDFISMSGAFTSNDTAIGVTVFSAFHGCGNGVTTWNATRR